MHIVDEKEMSLGIIGEIAQGDVLPVAGKIGEAHGLLVQHLEKARWAAAMLDIGLAVAVGGGEEDARLRLYETGKLRRDAGLPTAALLHALIGAARAFAGLHRLDGFAEGDIARGDLGIHGPSS